MTDITQRIADIVDKHTPSGATGLVNCWCGVADFHTFGQYAAHVAEVLTTELGLTREERSVWDRSQAFSTGYESRYVTKWVLDVS